MSLVRFPERIDPYKLFIREGSISSEVDLARMQRLCEYLSHSGGHVEVHLQFGHDGNGRRLVTGTLATRVTVQCQRCLEDFHIDIEARLEVRVAAGDEEARRLPAEMEAVLEDGNGLDLLAVVEDELILSLPTVPQHSDTRCNESFNQLKEAPIREISPGENAFAKLQELKSGKH